MKKYDYEKSEKDYIAETEEFRAPYRQSFSFGKGNGITVPECAMMLMNSKESFIFYTLIHCVGVFFAETIVCLFVSNRNDLLLISGAVGAFLIGTVCAVKREKAKVIYAVLANISLFMVWTVYLYILVTGLSMFLYGV